MQIICVKFRDDIKISALLISYEFDGSSQDVICRKLPSLKSNGYQTQGKQKLATVQGVSWQVVIQPVMEFLAFLEPHGS